MMVWEARSSMKDTKGAGKDGGGGGATGKQPYHLTPLTYISVSAHCLEGFMMQL